MNRMVNNIQLTWKLVWMLRTCRICNSMVRFSKYELYNKLLGCVTLFRVTLGITWTQPIYIHTHIILLLLKKTTLFVNNIIETNSII